MISVTEIHLIGDELLVRLLATDHWWPHFVVNTVFVAATLLLLLAVLLGVNRLYLACRVSRLTRRGATAAADLGSSSLIPSLFLYVLRQSWRRQVHLLLVAALSLPFLYASLELPKLIINSAINSGHFPIQLFDFTLDQIDYLLLLCFLFLVSLISNGALKYNVNLATGRISETLLRLMRLTILREWRRRGQPGGQAQLIPLLSQEVEPIAGFAGDAFALPILQGGTFLTILAFMMIQEPILGAAAITLLPVQLLLIPRLQRRINALARERVREIRRLGSLLDHSARSSGSADLQPVFLSFRRLQEVRFEIYRRKFFVKALSNFISQLTPFFFFTIGGYLVIAEQLSFGALVAVLGAYKDLSAPLRELFRYYQTREDVRVRYEEIRLFLADGGAVVRRRDAPVRHSDVYDRPTALQRKRLMP